MNLGIQGKTALITAGSKGIGAAIGKALSAEGVAVATAARTGDLTYDLMRLDAPRDLATSFVSKFGVPDILIHNLGGTTGDTDPFCGMDSWRGVLRMNLEIAIELNGYLVPHMQKKGWGRIVHVSSVAALENQGTVPYCTAKAALNAYVRSFGRVVAKDGIAVSAVMPGAVFTEGGYWDHPRAEAFVKDRMAIGRLGTVEEIASLVAWLCSDKASFVTGSCFLIDGGQGRAFEH